MRKLKNIILFILIFGIPCLISAIITFIISPIIKSKIKVEGLDTTDTKIQENMFHTMDCTLILNFFIIFHYLIIFRFFEEHIKSFFILTIVFVGFVFFILFFVFLPSVIKNFRKNIKCSIIIIILTAISLLMSYELYILYIKKVF
ncbi:MAG: hypothetical protein IJ563_01610 [Selenomonadaceae bacterium]|nr:hypothetical protein [Selenomonadaceae bacterium]